MRAKLIDVLCSLKLTLVLLVSGLVVVFIGTVAQADEGLYYAQARYFKSWFVNGFSFFGHKIPLPLPGGYLIGTLLLANLTAAHIKRFHFTKKRTGILMTHAGLILLLLGQLGTDMLSIESAMRLEEGETKNYSEDFQSNELVFIDTSDAKDDSVVSVPESFLARGGTISDKRLPLEVRVKHYWPNCDLEERPPAGSVPAAVTHGMFTNPPKGTRPPDFPSSGFAVAPRPIIRDMENRNLPAAVIELLDNGKSLGTWLVTVSSSARQTVTAGGKTFEVAMRFRRHYTPYAFTLLKFTHDVYRGTIIPKDFRARVRLEHPAKGDTREVDIWMNNPLRYEGLTYFQASFDKDNDQRERKVTILQVVRNPSWLTPYFACVIVGVGLMVQFMIHFVGFIRKRTTPAPKAA